MAPYGADGRFPVGAIHESPAGPCIPVRAPSASLRPCGRPRQPLCPSPSGGRCQLPSHARRLTNEGEHSASASAQVQASPSSPASRELPPLGEAQVRARTAELPCIYGGGLAKIGQGGYAALVLHRCVLKLSIACRSRFAYGNSRFFRAFSCKTGARMVSYRR